MMTKVETKDDDVSLQQQGIFSMFPWIYIPLLQCLKCHLSESSAATLLCPLTWCWVLSDTDEPYNYKSGEGALKLIISSLVERCVHNFWVSFMIIRVDQRGPDLLPCFAFYQQQCSNCMALFDPICTYTTVFAVYLTKGKPSSVSSLHQWNI